MKQDLKRIETTLHQIADQISVNGEDLPIPKEDRNGLTGNPQMPEGSENSPFFSLTVKPWTAGQQESKTPVLPKLKPLSFSNHRNAPNPALAMTLLQEIEQIVGGWQKELKQVLRQIQDVYLEGPIVDGWLESHSREPEGESGTLRQAKGDRLMDYVEVKTPNSPASQDRPHSNVTCESPRTGYRLCGLDADGQAWSRPCPPEQIASVSIAIARYQKLRLLLNRKQYLETRLSQLAETLVVLHSHLNS